MAYQDSPDQARDHLDPTDLEVAGRMVEDIENVEGIEEGLEDLKGLAGLAVVDSGAMQGLVFALGLAGDGIRSRKVDNTFSITQTNPRRVEIR